MKKFIGIILFFVFLIYQSAYSQILPTFVQEKKATELSGNRILTGVTLSNDGTKIFFVRYNENFASLLQYTLTKPFDVSSKDTTSEVSFNLYAGSDDLDNNSIQDLTFNNDGTKLFVIDEVGGMNIHTLSVPFDLSGTVTQDADDGIDWRTKLTPLDGNIRSHGIRFSNDGKKMFLFEAFVTGSHETGVVGYNLSTPYLPSSATSIEELDIQSDFAHSGIAIQGIDFDDDGTRLYIQSGASNLANYDFVVYKLSTPYDVSTAKKVGTMKNFDDASRTGTIRPVGLAFSSDGMKFYQSTWNDNTVVEYDLSCPFGIIICETDPVSNVGAQVEFAKNVVHLNKRDVFKRFEWLRRNEKNSNLNSNGINLNIYNPILASSADRLKNKFAKKKNTQKKSDWSYWSQGDISIGRVGDTAKQKPKEVKSNGIMFGGDKKVGENKFIGAAIRFGIDDVDIISSGGTEFDNKSLTLNLYNSSPLNKKSNIDSLVGLSYLKVDQLHRGQIVGERNGKQIFTAFNLKSRSGYGKFNITPKSSFDLGVTQLSAYSDFGPSGSNSIDTYKEHTFATGNISTGFTFDNFKEFNGISITRNGSFEYVADITPNTDSKFKNNHDNVFVTNSIEKHTLHNVIANIGFEAIFDNNATFGFNYERFQGLDENSSHYDSMFIKLSFRRDEENQLAFSIEPLGNNDAGNASIIYKRNFNGFDIKFDTNYNLFSKIEDYGLNLKISSVF